MIATTEWVQQDPPLGEEPSIMEWVQTAHTSWVKKRALKFNRLHINPNKHGLINDQKQEPWKTLRNPPQVMKLALPVALLDVHKHTGNQILLFKSIHQDFSARCFVCCHALVALTILETAVENDKNYFSLYKFKVSQV